jgi:hypothetical protein
MSSYKDKTTRGDIPDLDEHREKILKEFCWLTIRVFWSNFLIFCFRNFI